MKRLHIHLAVEDFTRSIGFYSTLFGGAPVVLEADHADRSDKAWVNDPNGVRWETFFTFGEATDALV